MKRSGKGLGLALGLTLCAAALTMSIAMQREGYLTYLNSDMASELLLARRQVDTGSLIQMDWLYPTEYRLLHMNLFYALAFLFTPSFAVARVIGNTLAFMLGMAACVFLCRSMRLPWGLSLAVSAMLPVSASMLYAANMTVAGYYIIHLAFAFGVGGLWLHAAESGLQGIKITAAYAAMCMLLGFLSVRYVLCFVCPMMAVVAMEILLVPEMGRKPEERLMRPGVATALGFLACVLGYAAAEVVLPRLFASGVGSAASFRFNPLDGQAMGQTLLTVFADFLKLLGWRGGAALFSPEGIVNLCVTGVLVLGAIMARRVYDALSVTRREDRAQRRMMEYALAAVLVNVFCFVLIQGTYLNRYLIPAVILLVPVTGIVICRERNLWLRTAFVVLLCIQVGGSSALLLRDTREQEADAERSSVPMMDAVAFLTEQGYRHGYGSFWNVRVIQERTQGALSFTGVNPTQTEDGAVCPMVPEWIRWMEPNDYSDLNVCPDKTFLLLTRDEEASVEPWLRFTGAPCIYQNERYAIYGFESSMELGTSILLGKMKLENARETDGSFDIDAGGRMRVPTSWREAGTYTLTFSCSGNVQGAKVRAYAGNNFELLAQQPLKEGENVFRVELLRDDKYFMLLFTGGEQDGLEIERVCLSKTEGDLQ